MPLRVWTPASLPYILFCNPAHKTEIGTTNRWESPIANHLEQSLRLTNQKWGAAVRSYLLHTSLVGAEVCCAIYQPHQPGQIYRRKTIFLSQTSVCWLLFVLEYVDFSMSNFNVQGHIPSTSGDALMGAKHDKVKKERAKGRLRGKKCSSTLVLTTITTMAMGEPAPMLVTW